MGLKSDGTPDTVFNPGDELTRAQFGTVLSRMIWGNLHNGYAPYYQAHLQALKTAGVMFDITDPYMKEVR